ncbi:proton-coupled amino acid transporter-like protein pathetic [Bacillus rossius redtenbacheri]|uniref:proton-coupled amino acid transporter-like protein pathetic n=1 Tax=Bacillus rossius redtenbacheri TaxID=93214 RepID=UPI002FDDDB7C
MADKKMHTIGSSTLSIIPLENFSSTTHLTENKSTEKQQNYDPFCERDVEHPNSDAGALAHLLKSSLGSGILAMPNAMRNAGSVLGMVLTLIIGFICTHCVHILVKSSHELCRRTKTPSMTFAETAEMAFKSGPPQVQKLSNFTRKFVNIALIATYYSALCVYIVFIATSVKQVIDFHFPEHELNIRLYILMVMPFLYGLGLIRNLKYLVPFSAMANIFIFVGFCITLYYMFTGEQATSQVRLITHDITTIPAFLSTVIFAMEGIGVVMPLENSMRNPSHFLGCPGVLNIGMTCVVLLYAVIGLFGYLKYGDDIQASISLNLPTEEILAQVVKLLIAAAILFSYGLQFFIPSDITWPMIEPHVRENWRNAAQNSFRIATITATVAVALAVPNLGPIISLVGAVCFSTLGLLCPAVIDTATHWERGLGKWRWLLWKNVFIIVFSLIALFTGAYSAILEIIEEM